MTYFPFSRENRSLCLSPLSGTIIAYPWLLCNAKQAQNKGQNIKNANKTLFSPFYRMFWHSIRTGIAVLPITGTKGKEEGL
jgi:hypothetical protein